MSDREIYFGSGCKAHECGTDAAAWSISKRTGQSAAIIMKSEIREYDNQMHTTFVVYGDNGLVTNLPTLLANWGRENGMAEWNIMRDIPEYQPPMP